MTNILQNVSVYPYENKDKEYLGLNSEFALISTKFTAPKNIAFSIDRTHLMTQLNDVKYRKVAIVSAPAGFGKTMLLAQWQEALQQSEILVTWLSLDKDENYELQFFRYVVAALAKIHPQWTLSFERMLKTANELPLSILFQGLINELSNSTEHLFLILDDYHVITNPAIHNVMDHFITYIPDSFHLIIGSRENPPLQQGKLLVADQVVILDDSQLKFDLNELAVYFQQHPKYSLTIDDQQRLIDFTEGWISGVQLVLQTPSFASQPSKTIKALSGTTSSIKRYFDEVVFDNLPPQIMTFLLETSILSRLNVSLCDHVTSSNNSAEKLLWLKNHQLFVCSLDNEDNWFRYHHLLSSDLQNKLQAQNEQHFFKLHEKASHWFDKHKLWPEAIRHALIAGEVSQTYNQAQFGALSLAGEGDLDTLVHWLKRRPEQPNHTITNLEIKLIWALCHQFRFADASDIITRIERKLEKPSVQINSDALQEFQATKAVLAGLKDDSLLVKSLCEPLLADLPEHNPWLSGMICNVLSYSYTIDAEPEKLKSVQALIVSDDDNPLHLMTEIYSSNLTAVSLQRQAKFTQAEYLLEESLATSTAKTGINSNTAVTTASYLSEIYYQRGQWQDLHNLLAGRLSLIDKLSALDGLLRVYVSLIKLALYEKNGDIAKVNSLFERGFSIAKQRCWHRLTAALLALQVQFYLLMGDSYAAQLSVDALSLLEQKHHSVQHCALSEITWYETLAKTRLLIFQKQYSQADELLNNAISEQKHFDNGYVKLQMQTLLALGQYQQGNIKQSLITISQVLSLAKKEQLHRCLLDEAQIMQALLIAYKTQSSTLLKGNNEHDDYINQLLVLFKNNANYEKASPKSSLIDAQTSNKCMPSLTERELEILMLVEQSLVNKEIARALDISTDTVKWHLKNIYSKLGVSGRMQAVSQGKKMGVLI